MAVVLALAGGYLVVRRRVALRRAIETLLALPWALPGTVFAIALAITFSVGHPLQLRFVLVGTALILPLAYLVRALPLTGRGILASYRQLDPSLEEPASWRVDDRFNGPAYAVSTAEQRRVMIEVSRLSGLVLDPVYTGKAFFGLWQTKLAGQRVLFLHTGGLPGLLADAGSFKTTEA